MELPLFKTTADAEILELKNHIKELKITRDQVTNRITIGNKPATRDAIKAVSEHVLEVQRKTSRDFIIFENYKITIKELQK